MKTNGYTYVGFEVFTAVVMKSTIFWDMTLCSPLSFNRRFGGTYRHHLQGRRNRFSKPASTQVYQSDCLNHKRYRYGIILQLVRECWLPYFSVAPTLQGASWNKKGGGGTHRFWIWGPILLLPKKLRRNLIPPSSGQNIPPKCNLWKHGFLNFKINVQCTWICSIP
jgi:hypothetical protein